MVQSSFPRAPGLPTAMPSKYVEMGVATVTHLYAVDDHSPHTQLANDLVQGRIAHKEFLGGIRC